MYLALLSETTPADPAVWFVCLLGVGVVFAGLVLLIGIVALMNFLTEKFQKTPAEQDKPKANTQAPAVIENKQEILAAVCAAIAEENGTDISAIRVLSFKKIN